MAGLISIIILNQQKGCQKCKLILCQQVALSELHKDRLWNVQRSYLSNEIIAFFHFNHYIKLYGNCLSIPIVLFMALNLMQLNLRLFKDPRKRHADIEIEKKLNWTNEIK